MCDEVIAVTDDDAFEMVKKLAAQEGVLAGSSGGAAVFAAMQVARRLGAGKRVATIIPDSAERIFVVRKFLRAGSRRKDNR